MKNLTRLFSILDKTEKLVDEVCAKPTKDNCKKLEALTELAIRETKSLNDSLNNKKDNYI